MKKEIKRFAKTTKDALNYVADSYEKFNKSQRYDVKAICLNCGYNGNVSILKGMTTLDAFIDLKCPNCKCATLIKNRLEPNIK